MKKISYILFVILAIGIFSVGVFFLVSMVSRDEEEVGVILTHELTDFLAYADVEFLGRSEHFSFSTGKIVFGAERSDGSVYNFLLVDDFEQHTKIDDLSYMSFTRYLGNDSLVLFKDKKTKNILNKKLKKFGFLEGAIVSVPVGQFEESEFSFVTEENYKEFFKEEFKLELYYCQKNNKCSTEEFEINFKV